jgi:glutathione synthase/RimK-type ligase-like ATP-grasp enzyme
LSNALARGRDHQAAMILILTVTDDLHALVVQQRLRSAHYSHCYIIECDQIAQRDFLSYGINYGLSDRILTSDGNPVALSDATVIWLRRARSNQILKLEVEDENARTVINNDSGGALTGYLATHFHGKWISTPKATYQAADKIGQLKAALDGGFRIPKTLISQSRKDVLEFFESCSRQMVVKTVVGAPGPFLQTVKVEDPSCLDDASFAAAPSIYQEYIPGSKHLRLHCFGAESYAAMIHSNIIDWRINLNVPITEFPVDATLHNRVRGVLDRLGLEMGIIDLKLTPEGELVWLEVNPQGQFLFLDALTNLRLADRFASYLLTEHQAVNQA